MSIINKNMAKTRRIAFLGLMLACIIVLSIFENMMPPLPMLPPGMKLGLSNVVTMYCLFFTGKKDAFSLAVLKSCFVFLTRGAVAGALSLSGGVFSLAVMIFLLYIFKDKASYLILSIFGAIFHNIGQFLAIYVILGSELFIYYFPILLVSGIVMGSITGAVLRIVLPVLKINLEAD